MGAPSVNIAFIEKSATAIQRGERGIIAMLLKESAVTKADYTVYSVTDIPDTLSTANKTAVEQALMGYQTAPRKILLHVITSASVETTGYTDALTYFATQKWDYLVIPSVETDQKAATVASWIKSQRTAGTYQSGLSFTSGVTVCIGADWRHYRNQCFCSASYWNCFRSNHHACRRAYHSDGTSDQYGGRCIRNV